MQKGSAFVGLGLSRVSASRLVGERVPSVNLGYLENGSVCIVDTLSLFSGVRSVVMGVPGAFTPVCSRQHVPDFVASADDIKASGVTQLICIAPNDPFTIEAWREQVDPDCKIRFLSDGNLEFCRALRLHDVYESLFLGERSMRYLLIVRDGVISHVRVDPDVLTYECTAALSLGGDELIDA